MPNELEKYGKKKVNRLKNFRCPAPFRDFMVFEKSTSVCCPEWYDIDKLQEDFPDDFDPKNPPFAWEVSKLKGKSKILENWNNKFHKRLRETISKGDYRYCSLMCPWLNKINEASQIELEEEYYDGDIWQNENKTLTYYKEKLAHLTLPERVYFNFDTSCNLKCPSCRLEKITNKINIGNREILAAIDTQLGQGIKYITLTGSGDPFYSNIFREWLAAPKEKRYPKLKSIAIISNGNLFTPEVWEKIKPSRKYINIMEWSIDAATKETYETKTRLNGKWDRLMNNMDFLATIENQFTGGLVFSFVIQDVNYKEINYFKELILDKFKNYSGTITIMYRAIQDWGHQSKDWMKQKNICDPHHPKHQDFLKEFYKVAKIRSFRSNEKLVTIDSNVFHLLDPNKIGVEAPKFI